MRAKVSTRFVFFFVSFFGGKHFETLASSYYEPDFHDIRGGMMFSGVEYTSTVATTGPLQLQSQHHHPLAAAVNSQSFMADYGHHPQSGHQHHGYNRYQFFSAPQLPPPLTMITTPASSLLPSPPDENDFYGSYLHNNNNKNCSNDLKDVYPTAASLSLLSPSSSSSSSASSCAPPYRQEFVATQQSHDCYGVPALPSIVDYQPPVTDYRPPPPVTDFQPSIANYRPPPVTDFQPPSHHQYYRGFCAQQPPPAQHEKNNDYAPPYEAPSKLSTAAPVTVKSPK